MLLAPVADNSRYAYGLENGKMLSRLKKLLKKDEQGVLDLPSIITGAIIVGILGAVTATTVLAVIPWFDNKVAMDDLSIIKTAQQSHYSDTSQYASSINKLYTERYLHETTSFACVTLPSVDSPDYVVYVKSDSKKMSRYTHATGKIDTVTSIPCTLYHPDPTKKNI